MNDLWFDLQTKILPFCVLVFIIGSTCIMAMYLFNNTPPEPQFWTDAVGR